MSGNGHPVLVRKVHRGFRKGPQGNVGSVLRAALSRRRLLAGGADELTDSALAEAVAAYGDATDFPELAQARELIATGSRRVRLG